MTTTVHYDENAPKRERYRVLRAADGKDCADGRWITVESFGTQKEADRFAQGFCLGSQYAPPPEPLAVREGSALELVKLARDEYKRQRDGLLAELARITHDGDN